MAELIKIRGRRLGKHAPKKHDKILPFSKYLTAALPAPPAIWTPAPSSPISWGQMLNNTLGDCTCAAAGHLAQWWTALAKGAANVLPDSAILAAYQAVSGYDPKTGLNDNGAAISDVLDYWRTTGIGGDQIAGSAFIDPSSQPLVKTGIWMFGGIDIGVQLPAAAQNMSSLWDVPTGQALTGDWAVGSWGGHSVPVIGYDADGLILVTWGQQIRMSWAFWSAYCDESYCVLSQD